MTETRQEMLETAARDRDTEKVADAVMVAAEYHLLEVHSRAHDKDPATCPPFLRALARVLDLVMLWPPDRQRAFLEGGAWESWEDIAVQHDNPPESSPTQPDGVLILDLTLGERF